MNESATSSGEGSPAVEQAEKQVLGNQNYQKVEVVHRFADSHPWVHPALLGGIALIAAAAIIFVVRRSR
ncbi:MAG TPA: hypothetical protein VG984_01780 [Candidatus Paceibacterota bacterium]|nr:hypothetical protein [Candidatus Paceibacterota bacterium]